MEKLLTHTNKLRLCFFSLFFLVSIVNKPASGQVNNQQRINSMLSEFVALDQSWWGGRMLIRCSNDIWSISKAPFGQITLKRPSSTGGWYRHEYESREGLVFNLSKTESAISRRDISRMLGFGTRDDLFAAVLHHQFGQEKKGRLEWQARDDAIGELEESGALQWLNQSHRTLKLDFSVGRIILDVVVSGTNLEWRVAPSNRPHNRQQLGQMDLPFRPSLGSQDTYESIGYQTEDFSLTNACFLVE